MRKKFRTHLKINPIENLKAMTTKTIKFRPKTEFRQSFVPKVRLLPHPLFLSRNFIVLFSHLF